jgi:hypothetical protein
LLSGLIGLERDVCRFHTLSATSPRKALLTRIMALTTHIPLALPVPMLVWRSKWLLLPPLTGLRSPLMVLLIKR